MCLLYPQYPKFRPPIWRVLHQIEGNIKIKSQSSDKAKLPRPYARGRPFLNIRTYLTFIGNGIVRFITTAYNQVFSYSAATGKIRCP